MITLTIMEEVKIMNLEWKSVTIKVPGNEMGEAISKEIAKQIADGWSYAHAPVSLEQGKLAVAFLFFKKSKKMPE